MSQDEWEQTGGNRLQPRILYEVAVARLDECLLHSHAGNEDVSNECKEMRLTADAWDRPTRHYLLLKDFLSQNRVYSRLK